MADDDYHYHTPGSRAIKIPLYPSTNSGDPLTTSTHRQRGSRHRHLRAIPTAESLEHGGGPSSVSSEETEPSPMSSHTAAYRPPVASVASPSDKDPRLPGGNSNSSSSSSSSSRRNDGGESKASSSSSQQKGKGKATPSSSNTPPPACPPTASSNVFHQPSSPLGPSMLASSSYKSINLNAHHDDPDEPPRLITYTKHSQGFIWNDELFLPSYLIGRYGGRKKQYDSDFGYDDQDDEACHVAEIFVTDEEVAAMGIS